MSVHKPGNEKGNEEKLPRNAVQVKLGQDERRIRKLHSLVLIRYWLVRPG